MQNKDKEAVPNEKTHERFSKPQAWGFEGKC